MKRILLLENDSIARLKFINLFRAAGFEVVVAANSLIAQNKLQEQSLDAIVLDPILPGIGGSKLIKTIRKAPGQSELPIFVCTSAARMDSWRRRATKAGATKIFDKATTFPDQIVAEVSQHLNGSEPGPEVNREAPPHEPSEEASHDSPKAAPEAAHVIPSAAPSPTESTLPPETVARPIPATTANAPLESAPQMVSAGAGYEPSPTALPGHSIASSQDTSVSASTPPPLPIDHPASRAESQAPAIPASETQSSQAANVSSLSIPHISSVPAAGDSAEAASPTSSLGAMKVSSAAATNVSSVAAHETSSIEASNASTLAGSNAPSVAASDASSVAGPNPLCMAAADGSAMKESNASSIAQSDPLSGSAKPAKEERSAQEPEEVKQRAQTQTLKERIMSPFNLFRKKTAPEPKSQAASSPSSGPAQAPSEDPGHADTKSVAKAKGESIPAASTESATSSSEQKPEGKTHTDVKSQVEVKSQAKTESPTEPKAQFVASQQSGTKIQFKGKSPSVGGTQIGNKVKAEAQPQSGTKPQVVTRSQAAPVSESTPAPRSPASSETSQQVRPVVPIQELDLGPESIPSSGQTAFFVAPSPNVSIVLNGDGDIETADNHLTTIFGWKPAEVLGKKLFALVKEESNPEFDEFLNKLEPLK